MKYLIAALVFFVSGFVAQAQTNRTVMVNANGVVQRPTNFITTNRIVSVDTNGAVSNPTNFWTANSNSINSVVGNVSGFNPADFVSKYQIATFANLATQTSGSASASATNSTAALSIPATNTDAIAGIRLIEEVNSRSSAGLGTIWGQANHSIWLRISVAPSFNGLMRATLGHSIVSATNIGSVLTNRGIGIEVNSTNSTNLQIRIIAHDGTNSTNGQWVAMSDIFQRFTIGIAQKTNGEVNLYIGTNYGTPAINTNATISGGPTSSGAGGNRALDVRIESTNTNSYGAGTTIYSAIVETSQ
jgi:hypothetical protein